MITFSHSTCPTARLFILKSLFALSDKCIIITDSERDMRLLSEGSSTIEHDIYPIHTLADFFQMEQAGSGKYIMPHTLLEMGGGYDYLRRKSLLSIMRNSKVAPENIIESLLSMGYHHAEYLDDDGSYKKTGSIIQIRDPWSGNLITIEWFDTEIDSIIETSRDGISRTFLESIDIKNRNIDTSIQRKEGAVNTELLKKLSGNIVLIGCDFLQYKGELISSIENIAHKSYHFTNFHADGAISLDVSIPQISHIDEFLLFIREEISQEKKKSKITIYTKYEKSVQDFFEYNSISGVKIISVTKGGLESCIWEDEYGKNIIITDDILSTIFVRTRTKKSLAKNLDLLLKVNPGDYVVHREHGIARFYAVSEKTIGDMKREYLELHYADGDKLFVPLTEIYRVSKYVGELEPILTSLKGKEWERTLEKTDEELEKIAAELIEIASKRTLSKGISFGKFPEEEMKFQSEFPYAYTLDQSTAIDEIFRDMEGEYPMDRLLSGDVGFGKTEVAMNAIFKAVLSGYQVAVISPLLVLADEHYETFCERLTPFGMRVGVLTRMSTPAEVKTTLEHMKTGVIDIVVGTHRLLSEDIKWKRLGLLVIDEEHKFGVGHKERIKKMRANVDILALSATPIPRSLNLALSGLKKISLLTTPPAKKKPIETIVSSWNETTIAHAIEYELDRGGQVIIVHNRIRGMESIEKEIQGIVRSAKSKNPQTQDVAPKIIITHGQMPGDQIEDRIHAFKKREYDILLTTTIIENGVNFLAANTIIILDPEDFGLAQLHQLRGRVGRKGEQGYCYLIYRKPELAAVEKERIVTIANNAHLGAGFEIAMRDMEIRGAGDVLGFKQAGKSKEVGLTLYFRLLEEKIESIKNEKRSKRPVKVELEIPYSLPESLFLSEIDKLNFFREIENIETLEELDEMEEEMKKDITEDSGLSNLFLIIRTRLTLSEYSIQSIKKIGVNYTFDFYEDTPVERLRNFLDRFDRKNRMILLSVRKIRVETAYWKSTEKFLSELVR